MVPGCNGGAKQYFSTSFSLNKWSPPSSPHQPSPFHVTEPKILFTHIPRLGVCLLARSQRFRVQGTFRELRRGNCDWRTRRMLLRGGKHGAVRMLPKLIRSLRTSNNSLPSLRRAFSLYDQINLINKVPDDQLRFKNFTETGFTINGVDYEGSLLCVGNLVLSWSPTSFSQVTPQSLSIFHVVRPIPEILVLGCGKYIQPVDPELRRFIKSTGMKLEAVDSRNAASTYNILNEEGRIVAAALLPYGVTN